MWRQGADGRRGYELLLGSDPDRTPRRINRWGWVREDVDSSGAFQVGLMRHTDEESVERGSCPGGLRRRVRLQGHPDPTWRAAGRGPRTRSCASQDDLTYYDLAELLRLVSDAPRVRRRSTRPPCPRAPDPGFLFAVADLVDRTVDGARAGRRGSSLRDVTARFNFNADGLRPAAALDQVGGVEGYGGRRYERLVRIDFESYNPKLRTTERFTLVCGTEGELKGIPVYVKYQPKWWFKAEGVLDDTQAFERERSAIAPSRPPFRDPPSRTARHLRQQYLQGLQRLPFRDGRDGGPQEGAGTVAW